MVCHTVHRGPGGREDMGVPPVPSAIECEEALVIL
jgi:hypothetical protein